jgi:hypothetical protein
LQVEVPQTSLEDSKPGQETASAFASKPSRDFDGGLLDRWVFTLTKADALAYLRLQREPPGWAKWLVGAWFMAGGAVYGLLPDRIVGAEGSWQAFGTFLLVMVVQLANLLMARGIWRRLRARKMLPKPVQAEFEEWIDCVAGTDILSLECEYLSPELIGQIVDTKTHIFILNHNTRIVVPKRAFATAIEADEMAQHLRELAAGPYYFDPQD